MTNYSDTFMEIYYKTGAEVPEFVVRDDSILLTPEFIETITQEKCVALTDQQPPGRPWNLVMRLNSDPKHTDGTDNSKLVPFRSTDFTVERMLELSKVFSPAAQQLSTKKLRYEPMPDPDIFISTAHYPVIKLNPDADGPPGRMKSIFVTEFPLKDKRLASSKAGRSAHLMFPDYHRYRFHRSSKEGVDLAAVDVYMDADRAEFAPAIVASPEDVSEMAVIGKTVAAMLACSGGGKPRWITYADLEAPEDPILESQEDGPSFLAGTLAACLGDGSGIAYTGVATHDSAGRPVLRPVGNILEKMSIMIDSSISGVLSRVLPKNADGLLVAVPGDQERSELQGFTSVDEAGPSGHMKDAFKYSGDLMFKQRDYSKAPHCYLCPDLAGIFLAQLSFSAGMTTVLRSEDEKRAVQEERDASRAIQEKANIARDRQMNNYATDPSNFSGEMEAKYLAMTPDEQAEFIEARREQNVTFEISTYSKDTGRIVKQSRNAKIFNLRWWNSENNPYAGFIFSVLKVEGDPSKGKRPWTDNLATPLKNSVNNYPAKYSLGIPLMKPGKNGALTNQLAAAISRGDLKTLQGWLSGGTSKSAALAKQSAPKVVNKGPQSTRVTARDNRLRGLIEQARSAPKRPARVRLPLKGNAGRRRLLHNLPEAEAAEIRSMTGESVNKRARLSVPEEPMPEPDFQEDSGPAEPEPTSSPMEEDWEY